MTPVKPTSSNADIGDAASSAPNSPDPFTAQSSDTHCLFIEVCEGGPNEDQNYFPNLARRSVSSSPLNMKYFGPVSHNRGFRQNLPKTLPGQFAFQKYITNMLAYHGLITPEKHSDITAHPLMQRTE